MTSSEISKPPTMAIFNEDLILEILNHLWDLHNTSWDQEFRPEAFRRFFIKYALVSRVWALPAERYVYRSTSLLWDSHYQSFESGVKNPIRGQALRDSIRVLEISISHSQLGNPLKRLDKLLRYCPKLIELRLHLGPEVNTLFLRSSQESRLRESLLLLRPTLRALQLRVEAPWTKTQVMKQIPELIPYSTLDFLSIVSERNDIKLPELSPAEWDVRTTRNTRLQWPLETNAHTVPMPSILYPDPESTTPLVGPETLRFYSDYCISSNWSHPFIELFAPRIKQLMVQTDFRNLWTYDTNQAVSVCPNLERLMILDFHPSHKREEFPTSHMYVLEPQDWHKTVETTTEEEESTTEDSEEKPPTPPSTEEKVLDAGDLMTSISHVVSFRRDLSKSWRDEQRHTTFRNARVFDPRWPSEAFTGRESTLSPKDVLSNYRWSWSEDLTDNHQLYMVALRQPSTATEESE